MIHQSCIKAFNLFGFMKLQGKTFSIQTQKLVQIANPPRKNSDISQSKYSSQIQAVELSIDDLWTLGYNKILQYGYKTSSQTMNVIVEIQGANRERKLGKK